MTKIKAIAASISALTLLAATPVSALAISTNVMGDTYVATNASTSVGVGVNVGASGSASGNASSASTSTTNTSGNTNADLSVPLVITRADVDNATVAASNVTAVGVQTKNDLSGYIAAQMKADANLSAVDTASDHVAVTYPEQAKLFGFIPITIDTTATTDASGNVSITQPWWSFLAAADQTALQASVQSSVRGFLGSGLSANAQLNASEQAALVTVIKNAMATAEQTNVSANANASTTGNVNAY